MNWLEDLNRAMGYIEDNLEGDIALEDVARQAACSAFHLQRMFPYLAGVTLSDYIRRRRMSRAACELAAGAKVIDVARAFGYESPTAFTRAFRAVCGAAPSAVARGEASAIQYPRLSFSMQIKGDEAMECTIVKKPAFRVVGYATGGDWTLEDAGPKATEFWTVLGENGGERIHATLNLIDGSEPAGLLGVSFCEDGQFKGYLVGVATQAEAPSGMTAREVPEATYAVFDCVGPMPDAMHKLQHRILAEWLPSSGYEWASKSDVEVYSGPNMLDEDYRSQVWLPIEKHE